jgi:asparagine synthetase B (glutamine-hydrolysing)
MCVIAGIYYFDADRYTDSNVIKRMTDFLYHRGSDREGFERDGIFI